MAASSASGEVVLFRLDPFVPVFLQSANDYAVDCLAFSCDGQFLASAGQSGQVKVLACGNLDSTLLVTEWGNPNPWLMQGFTGKVRQLSWSSLPNRAGAPLLAASSGNDIVVWERSQNPRIGWNSEAVSHEEQVCAIAFHPQSTRLASVGKDGWLHLWHRGRQLLQSLNGGTKGFSCLSWHPQGNHLVAGGEEGEIFFWSQTKSGQGFA